MVVYLRQAGDHKSLQFSTPAPYPYVEYTWDSQGVCTNTEAALRTTRWLVLLLSGPPASTPESSPSITPSSSYQGPSPVTTQSPNRPNPSLEYMAQ